MKKRTLLNLSEMDVHRLESLMGKLEDIPYEEGLIVAKELHSIIEQYDFKGKDMLLIDLLTSIGVFYGKCSMPQISGEYFSKVLKLAEKHSLRACKVRAESNLAICKAQNGNYHEAIELWKILIENEQDPTLRMNMNNNISVGYGIIGDYHKAINYAFAALEIAKKSIPDADNAKLSPLMNLSTAYEKMGDYDRSLKYVEEALILSRKLGNQRRECECLNNLSMIYNQMEEHELALAKAEEGLVLRKKYFAKPDHAVSYNNIGYILEGMGNLKEALQNYKIAMRLRNQNINVAFSTNTLLNIVSVYIQQNKLSFALRYLDKAKIHVEALKSRDIYMRYYSYLSAIQALRGNYEEAFLTEKELNKLLNSEFTEHIEQSVNKSEAEFYQRRIEEQAELYKKQNLELIKRNKIIRSNSKELKKSYQNLQNSVEALNWILSVISHDVRAPLANFEKIIDIMLEEEMDESESRSILESMKKSSKNMYKLVDEILDGIRLQRRKLDDRINISRQDIIPLLQQIYMIYQPIAGQKHLHLSFNFVSDQVYALVDGDLLKIIVRNFLNNAVKFTPEGGNIMLELSSLQHGVVISIRDDGIGISPSELKAMHKRKKPEYSARRSGGGIGLGWILCRESVKKMKGNMEVISELGKGTTINIFLPV